jgi:hypothetical protein
LDGHSFDLQVLEVQFRSSDPRIRKQADDYLLESSEFEQLATDEEVFDHANNLLQRVNGAMRLRDSSYRPVEVDSVYGVSGQSGEHVFKWKRGIVQTRAAVALSMEVIRADGAREVITETPADDLLPAAILEAATNDRVGRVLQILSQAELTWGDLYNVLDLVEGDLRGGQSLETRGWAPSDQVKLFTHTANNARALGTEARHGHLHYQPPAQPMSLDQAKVLIQRITRAWLDWLRAGHP